MHVTGIETLGDRAITTALTDEVITAGVSSAGVAQEFISDLDGMTALTLFVNFTYGSGGTTCAVIVQTCLDSVNWIDIARFEFTTGSAAKFCNLSGLLSKAIAAMAGLSTESVLDGVLGDRLRAKLSTTGVYAGNTSVAVRAAVR